MIMSVVIGLAASVIVGLVVFFVARSRYNGGAAVLAELRLQNDKKDAEAGRLRAELDSEKKLRIEAETRLGAAQKGFDEQRALIDDLKTEMTDTFKALSSAALSSSSGDFIRLASESLGKVVIDTEGKLGKHKSDMDSMIRPLQDMLKRYEAQLKAMEDGRHRSEGTLAEQIRALSSVSENLQKETGNLVSALRKPQVRGRWGEMQLRRVAELSGMSRHCDFSEQTTASSDAGRQRPDMIVHLPMAKEIVVDSKVSLDAYLDAVNAATDEDKKRHIERHARQVREHIRKLAGQEYWRQFKRSPELVVLFMPEESFLSAAVGVDPAIMEEAMQNRVFIATPTTLIAMLHAIAHGWRDDQLARNAEEVRTLGKELYDRMAVVVEHWGRLGNAIRNVNDHYDNAVGSMEKRVLPSVRRFKELGVTGADDIPALGPVERTPRTLANEQEIKG